MKKILFVLLVLLNVSFCFSRDLQDTVVSTKQKLSGQHSIYTEILGNLLLCNGIGYDYTLKIKDRHKLSFNCGFHYYFSPELAFTLSPHIDYLYGKTHHLELGIGVTGRYSCYFYYNWAYNKPETDWQIPLRIGYRYQKDTGGFFFRIAYTPFFTNSQELSSIGFKGDHWYVIPAWASIAFGYTFK